jgi:serralysin
VGVYVDLSAGTGRSGTAEGDTYASIEMVRGSEHNDTLIGDNGNNELWGEDGDDIIDGSGGADKLYGDDGDDRLKGGGGADNLFGGYGNDVLRGMEGDDALVGDDGDDRLYGGDGVDFLAGSHGADAFVWLSTGETGITVASADFIYDFDLAEGDRIDLHSIDADVYAAGNQSFTFIGTAAFSGTPGELNYYYDENGDTCIQLQTGTSADIEGLIRLHGTVTPEASWFVL